MDREKGAISKVGAENESVSISDAEMQGDLHTLEYLLNVLYFGARDELALRLIKRFGSLRGVFGASQRELMTVPGVTPRVASFFSFSREFVRQAELRDLKAERIENYAEAAQLVGKYFGQRSGKAIVCITDGAVTAIERLGSDITRDGVGIALEYNAERVILAECRMTESHNKSDRKQYGEMRDVFFALNELGIETLDYIEYSPPYAYSMFKFLTDVERTIPESGTPIKYGCVKISNGEFIAEKRLD